MDQTFHSQLGRPGTTSDLVRGFQDAHAVAGPRQHHRGREPVRTGADDDRIQSSGHCAPCGWTGMSTSVGCLSTMSATSTNPDSIRPVAASISLYC